MPTKKFRNPLNRLWPSDLALLSSTQKAGGLLIADGQLLRRLLNCLRHSICKWAPQRVLVPATSTKVIAGCMRSLPQLSRQAHGCVGTAGCACCCCGGACACGRALGWCLCGFTSSNVTLSRSTPFFFSHSRNNVISEDRGL